MNFFRKLFKRGDDKVRAAFMKQQESQDAPWAMFEINGLEDDGRVKVVFNWNPAFIKTISELGFQAETEEDSVQLFFHASQMRPTELADMGGDDNVQSTQHPTLSQPSNRIVK